MRIITYSAVTDKKSDPFYVIIRSDAKSYKRPNMENDQPLPDARRNYAGHSITNDVSYRSETITEDLNPNWKAHTIDTFWYVSSCWLEGKTQ